MKIPDNKKLRDGREMNRIDTLYGLLKRISEILTPETYSFYEYALHTSDDHGFLRTRWCWWDEPLADHKIRDDIRIEMISAKRQITQETITDMKKEDMYLLTGLKMQIYYDMPVSTFDDADWDRQLGYNYIYLIDLDTGEVQEKYMETIT